MNLLQMSFSGAVMILVIVVIRALTIHKLPKRTFLALWGIAAARLLIPFSLPSMFSVYSLLGRFPIAKETGKTGGPVIRFIPASPAQKGMFLPGIVPDHAAAVSVDPWMLVWAVGALACAVFFAAAYLKCRREFRASLPIDNEYAKLWLREHRIRRTVTIRQSDRISAPLTYGMFRPVILMPKTADQNDRDILNYVLTHEYVHIRRFDAVAKLVLTAALCVHWFNPAVWVMYVLANRDLELSCDEAVVCKLGNRTKSAYAMALIRMEETRSGLLPFCNHFSKNAIEERIVAIMKTRKTSLVSLIVAVALVIGMTVSFATSAAADGNPPQEAAESAVSDMPAEETENAVSDMPTEGAIAVEFDPPDGKVYRRYPYNEFETAFPASFRVVRGELKEGEPCQTVRLERPGPAEQAEEAREWLDAYVPLGLSYEIDPDTFELSMSWQGKTVRGIFDQEKVLWFYNDLIELYSVDTDSVDLEAVCERGKLTYLREVEDACQAADQFRTEHGISLAEDPVEVTEWFRKQAESMTEE